MNCRHDLVTIPWHGIERDEDHNNLVHAAVDDETFSISTIPTAFSISTIPMAVCSSVTDLWQHTELKAIFEIARLVSCNQYCTHW